MKKFLKKYFPILIYVPAFFWARRILRSSSLFKYNRKGFSIACPVCGSRKFTHLKEERSAGRYLDLYDQREPNIYHKPGYFFDGLRYFGSWYFIVHWHLCKECHNAYQNFPHTDATVSWHYDHDNQIFKDRWLPAADANTGQSEYFKRQKMQKAKYFIERTKMNYGSILDIGAGWGYACKYLQNLGYEVWGIDPSPRKTTYAKDELHLNYICNLYTKESFNENQFDGIISHHVLEHFINPKDFFEPIVKHLKPCGMLLLQLPCLDADLYAARGEHLIAYSKEGIVILLEMYGFKVIELKLSSEHPECGGSKGGMSILARKEYLANTHKEK